MPASDILDVIHERFLTRRHQHRRPPAWSLLPPKGRKNRQNKNFLIIVICFSVIWDYSHQKEYKSNENSPPFVTFNKQTLRFSQIKLYLCTRIFILNTYLSWQDLSRRPLSSMVKQNG